jgi:hypothetical protein
VWWLVLVLGWVACVVSGTARGGLVGGAFLAGAVLELVAAAMLVAGIC